jgi:hypothetical protein
MCSRCFSRCVYPTFCRADRRRSTSDVFRKRVLNATEAFCHTTNGSNLWTLANPSRVVVPNHDGQPLTEWRVSGVIGGYQMRGVIDLVQDTTIIGSEPWESKGTVRLIDWKTTMQNIKLGQDSSAAHAVRLYVLAARQNGVPVRKAFLLNTRTAVSVAVKLDDVSFDISRRWFINACEIAGVERAASALVA